MYRYVGSYRYVDSYAEFVDACCKELVEADYKDSKDIWNDILDFRAGNSK